jgi:hypothetical protein
VSQSSLVFAGPDEPVSAVRELIQSALGGSFTFPPQENEDPYLAYERADVYVGPHDHEDDEVAFDDGSWVPLRSQYPHRVEIRDIDRDVECQEALARRVFDVLKADGRWQVVYIDDMQRVVDSYQPR